MQTAAEKPKSNTAVSIVLVCLCSLLPYLILYASNLGSINPVELLLPALATLLMSLLLFGVLRLIVKTSACAALCAALVTLLSLNFHVLRYLTKENVWLALALYLVLAAGLMVLLILLRKKPVLSSLVLILTITVAALGAMNLVKIVPNVVERIQLSRYGVVSPDEKPQMVSVEEKAAAVDDGQRNLYYILLDEYADAAVMGSTFGYDASAFTDWLTEQGFSVSNVSYSNANNSAVCAADVCTLSYVSDILAKDPEAKVSIGELRRTGELFSALNELGYAQYQVSSHPAHYAVLTELSDAPAIEQLMTSTTVDGRTVYDLIAEMTPLSAFRSEENENTDSLFNRSFRARILRVFSYYDDAENLCFKNKTALFSYVLCPHTPFLFDANGETLEAGHRRDWTSLRYYRDQYIYMTKRLKSAVANILATDPNAVIILQSDHGVRGGYFTNEGLTLSLDDQRRIFNAVYIGGEPVDIDGLSAVNTLRYVLDRLGADYPLLDDSSLTPLYYSDQQSNGAAGGEGE